MGGDQTPAFVFHFYLCVDACPHQTESLVLQEVVGVHHQEEEVGVGVHHQAGEEAGGDRHQVEVEEEEEGVGQLQEVEEEEVVDQLREVEEEEAEQ